MTLPTNDSKPRRKSSTAGRTIKHPLTTLRKGEACLSCKSRKIRCSGDVPACQACIRTARFAGKDPEACVCVYEKSVSSRWRKRTHSSPTPPFEHLEDELVHLHTGGPGGTDGALADLLGATSTSSGSFWDLAPSDALQGFSLPFPSNPDSPSTSTFSMPPTPTMPCFSSTFSAPPSPAFAAHSFLPLPPPAPPGERDESIDFPLLTQYDPYELYKSLGVDPAMLVGETKPWPGHAAMSTSLEPVLTWAPFQ